MKKAINMRCTPAQFETLKPKLVGMNFNDSYFDLEAYPYLTNDYHGGNSKENAFNSIGTRSKDMVRPKNSIVEVFNEKVFLKACGIKVKSKQKFKVGSTVKVIKNASLSANPVGSIGIISELHSNGNGCRVIVKGFTDDNTVNNTRLEDLELIVTKEQKIEKLLKKLIKLNKQ